MTTGLLSKHDKQVLAKKRQGRVLVPISTQADGRSAESRAANPKLPPTQEEIIASMFPKERGISQHTREVLAKAGKPVTEAPKYNILETAKTNLRKDLLRPYVTPEMVEKLPGPLRPLGSAAREFTSPAQAALLLGTAGFGPALAAGIRGAGMVKGVQVGLGARALGTARAGLAGAVTPFVKGGFAARLGGEVAFGTGSTLAMQEVAERTQNAPMPIRLGAPLVAGLAGGMGTLAAGRATVSGAKSAARTAAPVARRLATEQGGFLRYRGGGPIPGESGLPVVFEEIKKADVELAAALKSRGTGRNARVKAAKEEAAAIRQLREYTLEVELPPEEWQRYQDLQEELVSWQEDLKVVNEAPVERAPKFGTTERAEWEAMRREKGIAPHARAKKKAKIRGLIDSLQSEIDKIESGMTLPEAPAQQGGNIQAGMGIGEKPAQGGLFENLRGEAEKIPLADTEQMALRQQRAAQIAAGQAEMPITKAAAQAPVATERMAGRATEPVAPREDWAFHRTNKASLRGILNEGMTAGDFTGGKAIDFPGEVTIRVRIADIPRGQVGDYGGAKWYLPGYEQGGAIPAEKIQVQVGRRWISLEDYQSVAAKTGETLPVASSAAGQVRRPPPVVPGRAAPTEAPIAVERMPGKTTEVTISGGDAVEAVSKDIGLEISRLKRADRTSLMKRTEAQYLKAAQDTVARRLAREAAEGVAPTARVSRNLIAPPKQTAAQVRKAAEEQAAYEANQEAFKTAAGQVRQPPPVVPGPAAPIVPVGAEAQVPVDIAAQSRIGAAPTGAPPIKRFRSLGARPGMAGRKPPGSPPTTGAVLPEPTDPKALVTRLAQVIRGSKRAVGLKEAEVTKELGRRAAIAQRRMLAGDRRGARAAFMGELPQAGDIAPVSREFTLQDGAVLRKMILDRFTVRAGKASRTEPFRWLPTDTAFTKLWDKGQIPTRSELILLEEVFGKEFVESVMSLRTGSVKAWELFLELWNTPRAMIASGDISASLRQGAPFLFEGKGKVWRDAFEVQLKSFQDERAALGSAEKIANHALYASSQRAGLDLTMASTLKRAAPIAKREEPFVGSRLIANVPVYGRLVRASERAYVTMLNELRFGKFVEEAEKLGASATTEQLKTLANTINVLTGRASLGQFNEASTILSGIFFAPRFAVSRFLAPAQVAVGSAASRKLAARALGSYITTVTSMLALADISGVGEVEWDPRSSDFLKLKIGNTRFDPWAGLQQPVVLVARLLSGQTKTLDRGQVKKADTGWTIWNFFENKLQPPSRLLVNRGEGFGGTKPFDESPIPIIPNVVYDNFVFLFMQDTLEAMRDDAVVGAVALPLSILGVGVQTHQGKPAQPVRFKSLQKKPLKPVRRFKSLQLAGATP